MWQRFSERARKAVFYSQEEAQKFGASTIGPEFLLLGAIREPDSFSRLVLERLSVDINSLKADIEAAVATEPGSVSDSLTLSPIAKRLIDLAYEEARTLRNNYIGTEHLLLGLIRQEEGLASTLLRKHGVSLEMARRAVAEIQDSKGVKPAHVSETPMSEIKAKETLNSFWRMNGFDEMNAWLFQIRQERGLIDRLCTLALSEPGGPAAKAILSFDQDPSVLVASIEESLKPTLGLEAACRKGFGFAELLALATEEARLSGQPFHGGHFLIVALQIGDNATAENLEKHGISRESLQAAFTQ